MHQSMVNTFVTNMLTNNNWHIINCNVYPPVPTSTNITNNKWHVHCYKYCIFTATKEKCKQACTPAHAHASTWWEINFTHLPCSKTTTSVQPLSARWYATDSPTIPPPQTTTLAWSGTLLVDAVTASDPDAASEVEKHLAFKQAGLVNRSAEDTAWWEKVTGCGDRNFKHTAPVEATARFKVNQLMLINLQAGLWKQKLLGNRVLHAYVPATQNKEGLINFSHKKSECLT